MFRSRSWRRRITRNNPRILHLASIAALVMIMLLTTAWIYTEATWLQPMALVAAVILGWCVKRLNDLV